MNLGMEGSICGVLVSGGLLGAALAGVLQFPVRHLLTRFGVYRLAWHRNLFDVSVYVILWGAVVWALSLF
jgi:hypothetical protein